MPTRTLPHPNSYWLPEDLPVCAGEYPFAPDAKTGRAKLASYLDAGLTYFLDLTEAHELVHYEAALKELAAERGQTVEYVRLPVKDNDVPTLERMREILDAIDQAGAAGHHVYVHCWGGVGRTGTVVGAYLVRRGATGEAALERVAALFGTMSEAKRHRHRYTGSPQTEPQRRFVREWVEPAPDELGEEATLDAWVESFLSDLDDADAPERPPLRAYRVPGTRIWIGEHPTVREPETIETKVEWLLDQGITRILNIAGIYAGPDYGAVLKRQAARRGVRVEEERAVVFEQQTEHTHGRLIGGLDKLEEMHRDGHAVYVHAKGIGGRLMVLLGGFLRRTGWSAAEALARVDRIQDEIAETAGHRGQPLPKAWRRVIESWPEGERARLQSPSAELPPLLRDRMRGALIGLAVGDALGTTLEFKAPGSFAPLTDMVGGGPFGLKKGEWTDDTSMALCLAESLIERRGFDAQDQMERYVRWWREGHLSSTGRCFDIGITVRGALQRFEKSGDPFSGSTDPYTAGNGSAMRLAPVPLYYLNAGPEAIERCAESSRTTHATPVAVDACRYLGALILGALDGATKQELLSPHYSPFPGYWDEHPLHPTIAAIAGGSFKQKSPPEIRGSSYVAEALEAALWAFHHGKDFREGALLAVNLGDDADTTGAIYGQLAGAFYGESGIPAEWRGALADKRRLDRYAELLFQLAFDRRPELSEGRKENAAELVGSALRDYGSPQRALKGITEADARYRKEDLMGYYMGGSMGARAAEAEALLELRVQLGLEGGSEGRPDLALSPSS